jgi:general stress protein YciG
MATQNTNPGNFANNREKASRAGQLGGQNSGGNFRNDREKASRAGEMGGRASHGGRNQTEE